jgi:hypothetical protein
MPDSYDSHLESFIITCRVPPYNVQKDNILFIQLGVIIKSLMMLLGRNESEFLLWIKILIKNTYIELFEHPRKYNL